MVLDGNSYIAIDLSHKSPIPLRFFLLPYLIGHDEQDLVKLSKGKLEMLDE